MRCASLLTLALAGLATAQEQVPLVEKAKAWFDKASSFAKSFASEPGSVAAAKVADKVVTQLTYDNWRSTLKHSGKVQTYDPHEAWMVYLTGGNKTCFGKCGRVDNAWNEAVTYLATDVSAPKLASIDCESQELLCGAWAANVANVWFFLLPRQKPGQPKEPTPLTIHPLNLTTTTAADITSIHTRKLYLEKPRYEGALHPIDGWVARFGLTDALAQGLYYMSRIPSWAFMIFLSLFSRYFVTKRMPPAAPGAQGGVAPPHPASTT